MNSYTEYFEWLDSEDRKKYKNWAVTYSPEPFVFKCEILQWENSNAKWYRPEPFEDRAEAGGYWVLWFPDKPVKILQVRLV